ncbi:MAG: hypothetical protein K6A45_08225 [Lachnospiraceae bacterium]|nr:hypothetical protein [Lachnospiraceae bacterium]
MRLRFFLDIIPYDPKEETYTWGPEKEAMTTTAANWADFVIFATVFVIFSILAALTVHDLLLYKRKELYPSGKPKVSQKRLRIVLILDIVFIVAAVLLFVLRG